QLRIACLKQLTCCCFKRLQDGQSSFLQASAQVTCAHFQRTSESASAPSSVARRFRRGEPLILAARLRFVNPLVRRKLPNRLAGCRSRFRRGSRTFWQPVWVSSTPREEVVFQTPHHPADASLVSEPPRIADFQKSASTSC